MASDPTVDAFKAIKQTLQNVTFTGIPGALERVRSILEDLGGVSAPKRTRKKDTERAETAARDRIDRESPNRAE